MLSPLEFETLADVVAHRVTAWLSNKRRSLTRQKLAPITNTSSPKLDSASCFGNSLLWAESRAGWMFAWHLSGRVGDACIL
ncbi:hypothetical protein CA51_51280 [Rosistilla oblonga]|nr:hypothetical protein CA51_51280 [Rosistilla oblonga]